MFHGPEISYQVDYRLQHSDDDDHAYAELPEPPFKEDRAREALNRLGDIAQKHGPNCVYGYLDLPFRLRITRNGCEFDDTASPPIKIDHRDGWPIRSGADEKALDQRLKQWHTNAQVDTKQRWDEAISQT
ncbi:hypothetical protein BD309DRAFT_1024711 [Dichomitus squalens]|nr:hypothetical protein BD309DRAFT_1024711 [Dichomitus squalens]